MIVAFIGLFFMIVVIPMYFIAIGIEEKEKKEKAKAHSLREENKKKEQEEARRQREEEARRQREEEEKEELKRKFSFCNEEFNKLSKEEQETVHINCRTKEKTKLLCLKCDTLRQYQKLCNNKPFLLKELWELGYGQQLYERLLVVDILSPLWTTIEKEYSKEIFFKWLNNYKGYFFPIWHQILIQYSSPQGRNNYEEIVVFNEEEIEEQQEIYLKEQEQKEQNIKLNKFGVPQAQCDEERKKLSPKLRFEVFKRDNYKCKICGKGREDGRTLHCDHIVPIAKGGLTTLDNLQTLCDFCNLGKGTSDM